MATASLFFRWAALAAALLAAALPGRRRPRLQVDNVILITLDTTRADALGPYGNKKVRTPVLDLLAHRGNLFENAYSHAPITLPSHSSILSGRLPTQHGVRNNIAYAFPADKATLASRLKAAGFATGAFVSSFILDGRFGLNAGFDVYQDHDRALRQEGAEGGDHHPAGERNHQSLPRLAAGAPGPGPSRAASSAGCISTTRTGLYEPPLPFRQAYADAPYFGEIASMDLEIGRIVAYLEKNGLAERTLLVVTADHGESFLEHGEQTHGFFCYAATTHVPLILSLPLYGAPGERFAHEVQSIDLLPSLLEALGLPADPSLEGRSLASRTGARSTPRR